MVMRKEVEGHIKLSGDRKKGFTLTCSCVCCMCVCVCFFLLVGDLFCSTEYIRTNSPHGNGNFIYIAHSITSKPSMLFIERKLIETDSV